MHSLRVHFNRESKTSRYAFAVICLSESKNRAIDFPCSDGPNEFPDKPARRNLCGFCLRAEALTSLKRRLRVLGRFGSADCRTRCPVSGGGGGDSDDTGISKRKLRPCNGTICGGKKTKRNEDANFPSTTLILCMCSCKRKGAFRCRTENKIVLKVKVYARHRRWRRRSCTRWAEQLFFDYIFAFLFSFFFFFYYCSIYTVLLLLQSW